MSMLILALAPPVRVGGKMFIAFLMSVLVATIIPKKRSDRVTLLSARRSILFTIAVIVGLEVLFPHRFDPGLDGRGVLAAIVGAVSAAAFLRFADPVRTTPK